MISFPTTPTVGQQYTSGAKSWRWNGVAWDALATTDTQVQRAESAATRAEAAATQIGTAAAFVDSNPIVKGSVDPTKQVRLEVDGLTAGQTRVITVPDKSGTLALLDDVTDAGDVRLIASVVPTAVAAINLPNVFSDAYEFYMVTLTDISVSNSQVAQLRAIKDGSTVETGSTYAGGTVTNSELGAGNTMGAIAGTGGAGGTTIRSSATIRVQRGASTFFDITGYAHNLGGLSVIRSAYVATAPNITGFQIFLGSGFFNPLGRINVYAFSKT